MKIREQFLKFITKRTKLTPEQIQAKTFSFEMNTGPPEATLADTMQVSEKFLEMAQETYHRMKTAPPDSQEAKQSFQVLFNTLPNDTMSLSGNPNEASSVLFGLRAKASEELNFGVREIGAREEQDGIFWAPLHQEIVMIDDFDTEGPALTRSKAILFVDTTPGELGGAAFVHPLVPIAPKLAQAEKVSDKSSPLPNPGKLRPAVREKLQKVLEADRITKSQGMNFSNNDYLYDFYQGDQKTAVLRIDSGRQGGFHSPLVPGVTDMESVGVVSFAQHPDQEYGEQLELNGEERKALLATLSQANRAIPEVPDGEFHDEKQSNQWRNKQMLDAASHTLSALVADGDLSFYEDLVVELKMSRSWLARLRDGEQPGVLH